MLHGTASIDTVTTCRRVQCVPLNGLTATEPVLWECRAPRAGSGLCGTSRLTTCVRRQAVPHVRRPGQERRIASPFLFVTTFTLAIIACLVLSRGTVETQGAVSEAESGELGLLLRKSAAAAASQSSDDQEVNERLHDAGASVMLPVHGLQMLYHFHPNDPEFIYEKARHEDKAKITTGYMTCCRRHGNDHVKEAYTHYFEDFPVEPLCIPGYHLIGKHLAPTFLQEPPHASNPGHCIACDANTYCPGTKFDKCAL